MINVVIDEAKVSDLSKAFVTVDHRLRNTLHTVGMSPQAASWFSNYLTGGMQCQLVGTASSCLSKGVLQGSVVGPIFFSIYINNLCGNISNIMYHFYCF